MPFVARRGLAMILNSALTIVLGLNRIAGVTLSVFVFVLPLQASEPSCSWRKWASKSADGKNAVPTETLFEF
jgi:hypothetical protein